MNVFLWSDLHVGHVNLAEKWRVSFGGTVPLHDAHVRDAWNSVVGFNDEVWILGDEAMGQRAITVPWIGKNLHGIKHLIPGNHTQVHEMNGIRAEKNRNMFEAVFTLHDNMVDGFDQFGIENLILCHFPWFGVPDHEESDRDLSSWYPRREDYSSETVLAHGHTHASSRFSDHAIHVGVDAWSTPVPLSVVEEYVRLS